MLRETMIEYIFQSLPSKEAGLLAGIILGDKTGMDKAFYNSLINSGVLHLVVVSGTNVMLVIRLVVGGLAGFWGRKKTVVVALVLAWGYAGLVGWQIPIIRAIILVTIYYWGQLLGRKYNVTRAFGVTLMLMFLIDWRMFAELSFWLTTMAFVGVITTDKIPKSKDQNPMLSSLKSSIWISLWVTPILALSMGKISLVGPITTVLVMVAVELATLVGMVGIVVGQYVDVAGKVILWAVYPLLKYGVTVVEVLGKTDWLNWHIKINLVTVIGIYLILIGITKK